MQTLKSSIHGHSARKRAFTIVELLVAISVSAIVLGAVATLAYAMISASTVSDDIRQKQAQVRYATFRIAELIKYSALVCRSASDQLCLWTSDSDADRRIGIAEMAYIETDGSDSYIRLTTFSDTGQESKRFTITEISDTTARTWLNANCTPTYINLVPAATSVDFIVDTAAPNTRIATVLFDVTEDSITKTYQINGALRGWAYDLISEN